MPYTERTMEEKRRQEARIRIRESREDRCQTSEDREPLVMSCLRPSRVVADLLYGCDELRQVDAMRCHLQQSLQSLEGGTAQGLAIVHDLVECTYNTEKDREQNK